MKVLLQWTKANPEGWVEFDLRDTPQLRRAWERLAKKAEPTGNETLDNVEGWVFDINVQGIHFGGSDHYAVELVGSGADFGLRITTWNDDPEDHPVGTRVATRWTLLEPAFDPAVGQINTRQTREFWADDLVRYPDALPYSQFVPPADAITRHGIWVSEQKLQEHLAVRGPVRGWREWIA